MNIYSTKKYCVYLTSYFGNKLPPFYIGSSSISRVTSGYKGTILSKKYKTIFKQEMKENPHLFKTQIVSTYYSRKMALYREKCLQKKLNVVRSSMYYNESVAMVNGMFGRDIKKELHPLYGVGHSVETRKKLSDNHHNVTGLNNPRARKIILISPSGEFIMCHGDLAEKCKQWNVSVSTVNVKLAQYGHHIVQRGKRQGWQFFYID